ncbi:hypothetical protein WEB32_02320 [Streptomyces netropsis]|uniref:hypothetical protein n=1 Tax=Streptomyces netropsis TaxID=55404 RepID=UPI0030D165FC
MAMQRHQGRPDVSGGDEEDSSNGEGADGSMTLPVLWMVLLLGGLWWAVVAAGTDGYDAEPCGDGPGAGGCVRDIGGQGDLSERLMLWALVPAVLAHMAVALRLRLPRRVLAVAAAFLVIAASVLGCRVLQAHKAADDAVGTGIGPSGLAAPSSRGRTDRQPGTPDRAQAMPRASSASADTSGARR